MQIACNLCISILCQSRLNNDVQHKPILLVPIVNIQPDDIVLFTTLHFREKERGYSVCSGELSKNLGLASVVMAKPLYHVDLALGSTHTHTHLQCAVEPSARVVYSLVTLAVFILPTNPHWNRFCE